MYRLKQQEENRKLCGNAYCEKYTDYIYVNELGERIKLNYITQHFPLALEKTAFQLQGCFGQRDPEHLSYCGLRHGPPMSLLKIAQKREKISP